MISVLLLDWVMSPTVAGSSKSLHVPTGVSTLLLISSRALNSASRISMWFQLWFHGWLFYSTPVCYETCSWLYKWLNTQNTSRCRIPILHTTAAVLPLRLRIQRSHYVAKTIQQAIGKIRLDMSDCLNENVQFKPLWKHGYNLDMYWQLPKTGGEWHRISEETSADNSCDVDGSPTCFFASKNEHLVIV